MHRLVECSARVGVPSYAGRVTPKLTEYIAAGKALDADEREVAALTLQQVDESEQAELDAAWDETIDRRLDELTSGKVQPVSGRETIAIARARAADQRT